MELPAIQSVPVELERATVERARAGDQQSLADLYDWYMPRVYRYAVARLGDRAEAEDLTEEVFLRMLGGIADFRWRDVPFSSWLFRIAHNEVVTHYRKNARRGIPQALTEDMEDGRDTPHAAVEDQITLEEVRRAAADLPEAQREVIALRFAVGLSIAETAKALGKREGNVKALQHKAVLRLRQVLLPDELPARATVMER